MDDQLFQAIKNDDYVSFNRVFNQYYARLCFYVRKFTGSPNEAEDIVQELFIRLWVGRHKIMVRSDLSAYLYQSARNSALNWLRAEKVRQKAFEGLSGIEEPEEDDLKEKELFLVRLSDCLEKLPERSKQVFIMHRMEEMKLADIAEKVHTSVKTIKNQIWKSMLAVRACLQSKKDTFPG